MGLNEFKLVKSLKFKPKYHKDGYLNWIVKSKIKLSTESIKKEFQIKHSDEITTITEKEYTLYIYTIKGYKEIIIYEYTIKYSISLYDVREINRYLPKFFYDHHLEPITFCFFLELI